jgi:hypothetical protein
VRTPGKLTVVDSQLRVVPGDIQRADSIHAVVPGHEAVLSALGARSLGPTTPLSDAAREIVGAMQAHGVRRIIWESSLGVDETRGRLGPFYNSLLIPLLADADMAAPTRLALNRDNANELSTSSCRKSAKWSPPSEIPRSHTK